MSSENGTAITKFILLGLSGDPTTQILLFIVFLHVYVVILFANSLIIVATATGSNLQTPMYFFLTHLSLVDIFFSSAIIPRMLIDMLAAQKSMLLVECVAQMYISLSLGTTECLLLAVLAYDRYIAICYPLHYTTIISRAACIKMVAGTWLCGFSVTIAPQALTWHIDFCGHNVINHFFCDVPRILSLGCGNLTAAQFVVFVVGVTMLIAPIAFIIVTYILIIRAIIKIDSSTGRKKTFSTCGSHVIVVTMFYGSAIATYMKPQSVSSVDADKLFAVFYAIVTPMLNPLIYTLRNKDVQSAVKKAFNKYQNTLC
ncbi:olfactory receptor 2D3-like [Gastrophryne carolinensis]